jgi:hypothetical protein
VSCSTARRPGAHPLRQRIVSGLTANHVACPVRAKVKEEEVMNDQHAGITDQTAQTPDPGLLLSALTTEHFTLQGARSQTMSESSARASVYVFSLSSTLVALGFIGQVDDVGGVFYVFALTVLPTLYLLGAVTFVRLVECGAEDFRYGMAINRIRHYYKELAGDRAGLFLLSGHDDGEGVFANMGLPAEGRKPYFAFSSAVIVINSLVGGATVALALGAALDAPLGVAAGVGGGIAIISTVGWINYAGRRLAAAAATEPMFPSPPTGAAD